MWLSEQDAKHLRSAEGLELRSPIPTQMISNGEFMPLPQTREQREVERRLAAVAGENAGRLGLTREQYLRTRSAMTAAFGAMNDVHGQYFEADRSEELDQDAAAARARRYADQFVFDAQTHHVRPSYDWNHLTNMRRWTQGQNPSRQPWNPAVVDIPAELENYKFDAYIKDMFFDSDTKLAILTGFTSETPSLMPLSSDEIVRSRDLINRMARSRRVYAQGLFWPGYPGNLEEMDRVATELHIDSWKGYAVGDPLCDSKYPWRMDDEKLAYPCYEKARKYGIRNVCVHKGLLPAVDYKGYGTWPFAMVDDVARAAKDWPDLNFIIYHAAFRPLIDASTGLDEYRETGRVSWVTDLAEACEAHQLTNVYAELGTTFASVCVTFPELAAAILGICVKGMGADRVVWGTDSIWWGSPQWQIEALRRLEIPEAMRARHGFAPLGPGDGEVKNKIFGLNLARLFNVDTRVKHGRLTARDLDGIDALKAEYERRHPEPSQVRYGWVRAPEAAAAR
jgi:predicted TIM-barrel fold metal-dependent hydrolase